MKKSLANVVKPLVANSYDKLLLMAIKRHRTIFSEASVTNYARIVVKHWDGSIFDINGDTYEYATLRTSVMKQRVLIIYPHHHPVVLFILGGLDFADVYNKPGKKTRIWDASIYDGNEVSEYFYMDSLSEDTTGIKNVVLYVGPNPMGMRVMVTTSLKKLYSDSFALTIPDLRIIGKINNNITPAALEKIKKWILLNQQVIEDYSNMKMFTNDFIELIKKV